MSPNHRAPGPADGPLHDPTAARPVEPHLQRAARAADDSDGLPVEQPVTVPVDAPAAASVDDRLDEPVDEPVDEGAPGGHAGGDTDDTAVARPSPWQILAHAFMPRATKGQLLTGVLCAILGFAVVVQVQANRADPLSALRQDELVRLLDDVTRNGEDLADQIAELRAQRNDLATASDGDRAAREAARERARVQGILAGRLPAEGPGIELLIADPTGEVSAATLYTVLEELRNAGAEAVQLGELRLTASSYIVDTPDGVEVDGTIVPSPYRWLVIGDPETITTALGIPGGALAVVRNAGGTTSVTPKDLVRIDAVRLGDPPRYATPVPADGTD